MSNFENKYEAAGRIANKYSRGYAQWYVIRDLILHGETGCFCNYMKSQSYYANYLDSFHNAVRRVCTGEGLKAVYVKGQRGGSWTAYYKLV